ncbi:AraC-like ligand-binding domain-containing protein [Nocardiopsis aegyptia]|uniref:AraC-like DNA-binding protein n=1 Tax=Nocardiopsis aegyptia TaxID=220378 RepID=A0A7Z0ENE6_9ACTN|nr:helix-turn-helix domain-containing protein [Nocardiopsis aegyptia]NYJ35276.1 AraC-like DNA-binding protein [Nocardiopsis aegyptia]
MTTAEAVDRVGPSDRGARDDRSGDGGQIGQDGRSGHTDRIDHFEAAASGAFAPLRMRTTGDSPFQGAFTSARVDQLVLTHITAAPVVVRRDADVITSTDPDLIKVAWHGSGRAGVGQGGRQCLLSPGDLVVYETAHPYELPFWEPYDTVVVGVPSSRFGAHADVLRRRVAMPVRADGGLRGIVSAMFRGMASGGVGDGASGAAQHHLASALVSLVCAAFSDTVPSDDEDPMGRVRAYCLANLGDPGLSVESVAAAHGMSTRYLYKLCRAGGFTLARWVRSERLARIRRDLADPVLAERPTAVIAARWGVLDTGHLGRMLRAEFGVTAREIRAGAGRA